MNINVRHVTSDGGSKKSYLDNSWSANFTLSVWKWWWTMVMATLSSCEIFWLPTTWLGKSASGSGNQCNLCSNLSLADCQYFCHKDRQKDRPWDDFASKEKHGWKFLISHHLEPCNILYNSKVTILVQSLKAIKFRILRYWNISRQLGMWRNYSDSLDHFGRAW